MNIEPNQISEAISARRRHRNLVIQYMQENKVGLRINYKEKWAIAGMFTKKEKAFDYNHCHCIEIDDRIDCTGGNELGERNYIIKPLNQ